MAHAVRQTPSPKTEAAKRRSRADNKRVDRESNDSFPASDPPSHNSGAVGAPKKRITPLPDMTDFDEAAKGR